MGNDGFPGSLAAVVVAAIAGMLLVAGLVIGLVIYASVPEDVVALKADFTAVVDGNEVYFSADQTVGGSQPYTKYAWDFDNDGEVDLEADLDEGRDVSHEFDSAGTHMVRLTVTDTEDVVDSVVLAVTTVG